MFSHQSKIYFGITVISLAVILLAFIFYSTFFNKNEILVLENSDLSNTSDELRGVLNGQLLENIEDNDFYAVVAMFDNAYDARPQYGLQVADIVYEALAEGNITRLMGVFNSSKDLDKMGPIRSARPYFMDWADEYGALYMHVGGSPDALSSLRYYNLYDVDQIGAGEIYFWRDNDLLAPHNVFSSSANWLRAGEMREVPNIKPDIAWNFVEATSTLALAKDISIAYRQPYNVDWQYNENIGQYLRSQGDEKFIYDDGKQVRADNVVVQIVDSRIVDDKERRTMDTEEGGKVFVFNNWGVQEGVWEIVDGRTRFFDENKNELKLVAGITWVQVVPSEEMLIVE